MMLFRVTEKNRQRGSQMMKQQTEIEQPPPSRITPMRNKEAISFSLCRSAFSLLFFFFFHLLSKHNLPSPDPPSAFKNIPSGSLARLTHGRFDSVPAIRTLHVNGIRGPRCSIQQFSLWAIELSSGSGSGQKISLIRLLLGQVQCTHSHPPPPPWTFGPALPRNLDQG